MRKIFLALILFSCSAAANAVQVRLVSHQITTTGPNNIRSIPFITDGSHISGISPASTVTWDWDGSTLTGTGFYGTVYSAVPASPAIYADQISNLTISTGGTPGGTASATVFSCVEGTITGSLGISFCGGYNFGANFIDESATTWGPGTAVSQTLGGDDFIDPDFWFSGVRSINSYDYGLDGLTGDGLTPGDLILIGNGLAQGTPEAVTMTFQVVPVPAAAWLFGSAMGFLGLMRRMSSSVERD